MSVTRLGNPAIPVKSIAAGTYLAKLDHLWRAARRYAERGGYTVVETYGVMGVAPFCQRTVPAWLGYLGISYREPIHYYEIIDNKGSWVAEWASD